MSMSEHDKLNWLRDHMLILDQSEPDSYENLMEAVVGVLETAWKEWDAGEATYEMTRSIATLNDAMRQRRGTGSAQT